MARLCLVTANIPPAWRRWDRPQPALLERVAGASVGAWCPPQAVALRSLQGWHDTEDPGVSLCIAGGIVPEDAVKEPPSEYPTFMHINNTRLLDIIGGDATELTGMSEAQRQTLAAFLLRPGADVKVSAVWWRQWMHMYNTWFIGANLRGVPGVPDLTDQASWFESRICVKRAFGAGLGVFATHDIPLLCTRKEALDLGLHPRCYGHIAAIPEGNTNPDRQRIVDAGIGLPTQVRCVAEAEAGFTRCKECREAGRMWNPGIQGNTGVEDHAALPGARFLGMFWGALMSVGVPKKHKRRKTWPRPKTQPTGWTPDRDRYDALEESAYILTSRWHFPATTLFESMFEHADTRPRMDTSGLVTVVAVDGETWPNWGPFLNDSAFPTGGVFEAGTVLPHIVFGPHMGLWQVRSIAAGEQVFVGYGASYYSAGAGAGDLGDAGVWV